MPSAVIMVPAGLSFAISVKLALKFKIIAAFWLLFALGVFRLFAQNWFRRVLIRGFGDSGDGGILPLLCFGFFQQTLNASKETLRKR